MNRFIATFIVLATLCAGDALAQAAYPHRPVHIIVPFPPGGPADALARLAADKLAQSLGEPFIVDNKAGAGGNIGMEQGDIVHVPFNGVAPATNAEQGLPDFEATSWYALVAPAGTPAPIIERLHGALVRALALPDVREKIAALGAEPVGNSPSEFATMQRTEGVRCGSSKRRTSGLIDARAGVPSQCAGNCGPETGVRVEFRSPPRARVVDPKFDPDPIFKR